MKTPGGVTEESGDSLGSAEQKCVAFHNDVENKTTPNRDPSCYSPVPALTTRTVHHEDRRTGTRPLKIYAGWLQCYIQLSALYKLNWICAKDSAMHQNNNLCKNKCTIIGETTRQQVVS